MGGGRLRNRRAMSETVQFRVMDFSCPTCAGNVERALANLGGVEDVEVHFTTGRIEVEYDGSAVATDEIERTIEKQGYTPRPA